MRPIAIEIAGVAVETNAKLRMAYAQNKRKLIDRIGLKDPHTIPRNLYLMSGKAKLSHVMGERNYIGRNNRFKLQPANVPGARLSRPIHRV